VTGSAGDLPSRDQLTLAWADHVLPHLKPGVKALFAAGRFIGVEHGAAEFAVPNAPHREKCEAKRKEVEEALAAHFHRSVPLRIVVDSGSTGEGGTGRPVRSGPALRVVPDPEPDDDIDIASLSDAPPDDRSPIDRLAEAFPGAELLEE